MKKSVNLSKGLILGFFGILLFLILKNYDSKEGCIDTEEFNIHEIITDLDDIESMLLDIAVISCGKMSMGTNKRLAMEFRAIKDQINRLKKKLNLNRGCTNKNDEHHIEEVEHRIDNIEGYLLEVILNKFERECVD